MNAKLFSVLAGILHRNRHEPSFHVHDLRWRFAVQLFLHVRGRERARFRVLFRDVCGHDHLVADFAVHLYDEFERGRRDFGRIERRPRRDMDARRVTVIAPQFFRHVRREWGDDLHESFLKFLRHTADVNERIRQDHELGHSRIKRQ